MIFDEITIHNFGVYSGRQSLLLSPPSANKPVILIGGLNGGGKTTLLDALHLTLYGKRARCSNRGSLGYEEFLRQCINRRASQSDGAALEVKFRQWTEGVEHTYQIHRSWSAGTKAISERVEVVRDGAFDRVLTEAWSELVEELIPVSVSHLFFFDGEKIEGFADFENSAQLLSKAIHALLGLDLVDRLATDLLVLERRKQVESKNDIERQQIEAAKAEIACLEQLRAETVSQKGSVQNVLDRLEKRLKDIVARFEQEGGALFENRKELEEKRASVAWDLWAVEDELINCAEGAAPLLLLTELLTATIHQDRQEESAAQANIINQILALRDKHLLAEARKHKASEPILKSLKKFLADDRKHRTFAIDVDQYLNLRPEARESLHTLRRFVLPETHKQVQLLIQKADELQGSLADLDRKIAGIPSSDSISSLLEHRQEARLAVDQTRERLANLNAELKRINRELEQKQGALVAQFEKVVEKGFEQEDTSRVIFHSQRVRRTLDKFRSAMVERHVRRIALLVLDSFRQLLRKESLVVDLKIDPKRFSLELRGKDGKILSPDRLSAGERQLLAVSMLWGLARASGRPLPTVIDTPLGRLDASHRSKLVERYFPYASHQVLLLSTDEEIDEKYYEQLKPHVGRTYHLEFNDATGATHVKQGYFW